MTTKAHETEHIIIDKKMIKKLRAGGVRSAVRKKYNTYQFVGPTHKKNRYHVLIRTKQCGQFFVTTHRD